MPALLPSRGRMAQVQPCDVRLSHHLELLAPLADQVLDELKVHAVH
jgi:hypothetical protein